MTRLHIALTTVLLSLLIPFAVSAENSTAIPGYTIHHNAFSTDILTPQVARTYGLQRSKNRGMLNVSVIRQIPGTMGQSVAAVVKTHATNLTGQSREIPMREIKDGDAIYYIGDFRVADLETLDFVIEVAPEGESRTFTAKMRQQFFTE